MVTTNSCKGETGLRSKSPLPNERESTKKTGSPALPLAGHCYYQVEAWPFCLGSN